MSEGATIAEMLGHGTGNAPAIAAPEREPLTYDGLRALCGQTVEALNRLSIGRGDRVAIVLPNGPEMATAFLAVACGAATAPLNPAYKAEEFAFYLTDLGAKALLVERDSRSPACAVATRLGLPVLELAPDPDRPAGHFTLHGAPGRTAPPHSAGPAEPDDVALLLHTSGTTSRPKLVPLLHRNLVASAGHILATLRLGPEDRCLNIMPLFHIHGVVAAVASSLAAGGSVVCSPGFNALKVLSWLEQSRPTWYTAVPTMHQAILARAARREVGARGAPLRLIRSSSSSLPSQVMRELEQAFGCPVIESYGMTEASHQMTSNQLPPGQRKPGSVGVPAGPSVAIMNPSGELLPIGAVGEIVIQGPNVTPGYENNPEANATAFVDGWFRTGDQGVFDRDGFLTLTGRLKELINRGGEKISPREVDEVLMDHPGVQQVVTFALPHPKLGEEVAAAVVLREGASADEEELRGFAAERLAGFKVPRRIVFLEEIPKGATGKLQRIGLAERLGLVDGPERRS